MGQVTSRGGLVLLPPNARQDNVGSSCSSSIVGSLHELFSPSMNKMLETIARRDSTFIMSPNDAKHGKKYVVHNPSNPLHDKTITLAQSVFDAHPRDFKLIANSSEHTLELTRGEIDALLRDECIITSNDGPTSKESTRG